MFVGLHCAFHHRRCLQCSRRIRDARLRSHGGSDAVDRAFSGRKGRSSRELGRQIIDDCATARSDLTVSNFATLESGFLIYFTLGNEKRITTQSCVVRVEAYYEYTNLYLLIL